MMKVRKLMVSGYAASWRDGTEFIDPDPIRAVAIAAGDELRRLEAGLARAQIAAEKRRKARRVAPANREPAARRGKPRVRLIGGAA